jgi:hypothetical protein
MIVIIILSIKSEFLPEYIKLRAMPVLPSWRISWLYRQLFCFCKNSDFMNNNDNYYALLSVHPMKTQIKIGALILPLVKAKFYLRQIKAPIKMAMKHYAQLSLAPCLDG